MYARKLDIDRWAGISYDVEEFDAPPLEQIVSTIQRLDSKTHTIVTIVGRDEQFMVIGGGLDGKYVVYIEKPDEYIKTLLSDDESQETFQMSIGGQEGDYPLSIIVTIDAVLRVARTFFELGAADSRLKWRDE